MRRGVWLVLPVVVAAVLYTGTARAAASVTTTTGATSTGTTTAPSYADVPQSFLPRGCVGAGAAALVVPAHPVVAFDTPASSLGPSAYSPAGTVLSFASSTAFGSTCSSAGITLSAVSLFDGAVTATSVQATAGKGTVTGLAINGSAAAAGAGQTEPVGGWGQLTLGAIVGRVSAPLVVRLLQPHDSLPAGTVVAVGFAASAERIAPHRLTHRPQLREHQKRAPTPSTALVPTHSAGKHLSQKERRREPLRQPPDYPSSSNPLLSGGALAPAVEHNPVVSLAVQYLGIPYEWAGANPNTGFDCSGLVKYVFAQLGVTLPHYAAAQWSSPDAVPVPPDKLQPGDLVFFTGSDGTRKAPGHVGIYLGDGYLIDAPHTGAFVEVDSLKEPWFADKYVGARRIVGRGSSRDHSRHLLRAAQDVAFVPSLPLAGLPRIAMDPTAVRRYSPREDELWTSVGLGSVLLLLSAGAFTHRRRRRAQED